MAKVVDVANTLLILTFLNTINSLNILAIIPYQGISHSFVYKVHLKELTNKGHNVTVISHFPEKDPPKNYYDISLAGSMKIYAEDIPVEYSYLTIFKVIHFILSSGNENCEVMLKNREVQKLVEEKRKFDVVLVEQFNSDCALGIAYKLGTPVVTTASFVIIPWHYSRFGILSNPSYVPFIIGEGGTNPTLYQRVESFIIEAIVKAWYLYYFQANDQNTLAKYYDDIPPLEELAKEIKFTLQYQHPLLTSSRLYPANVIEVGGYHVTEAKPLTEDLKEFVDKATHGVVYISFGSVVKASTMDPEKVQLILEVMNMFPQKFIWKWEDKSLVVDKNKVYISNWLPQTDILAHPKTLAFYSHAGMGSTTESMHYGVPMIAMPIAGDQPSNAAAIAESGLGVVLQYRHLTKETFVEALKTVLDAKFRNHVKDLSSAWHDRPQSALDTAVFWTEYAAYHPSVSFRARSVDVPIYQFYCIDVFAVMCLLTFVSVSVVKFMCCGINTERKCKRD